MHLFKWQQHNILLDVNSGAIHLLDDMSRAFISRLMEYDGNMDRVIEELKDTYPADDLNDIAGEIIEAWQEGALFSKEDLPLLDLSGLHIKALCLNVAHACNMKCRYCFASQGDFGMEAGIMSLETGKRALDYLMEQSGPISNLEVDFFGGEPLLAADMLKHLVAYGRELERTWNKHINFTLTTNALLITDEIIDFVQAENISVILSLDGRPQINDRHRILNNGAGTYDLILPRIKKMVDSKPKSYYIRGTFTKKNLDFSEDLRHIAELGFDSISLEPAVGEDNGYSIQEEDLGQVLAEYERLTDLLYEYKRAGRKIDFFHYNLDMQKGPCLAKRLSGCGAGMEYLVVTPNGDIYPCHQFVGEKEFLLGNIFNGQLNEQLRSDFAGNHLQNKSECRKCWARYFCGGGCHANAYHTNGDIRKPSQVSCIMHRKRIEGAIFLETMERLTCI
ncbi:MAG: thioether cross-link-forming SCIFF peptide maturase [Syntrophomonadaceae bacterium]|nr:thioether cross-link-forming SCIFF peptide maturase [Syntrophomonadaceae bacterium]